MQAALEQEVSRLKAVATGPDMRVRWGLRLLEDPFATTEQGRNATSFAIDGFLEGAVADDIDRDELTRLLGGAASRLGGCVDWARSVAIAGTEYVIFPGDRPVLLLYALRRLPSLTHDQFCDHWLQRHAEFARPTQAERGYRQLHADPGWSADVAVAAGVGLSDLDGVAEASYGDMDDFLAVMARPEIAADAMEDEKRFIDHSRSAGALTGPRTVDPGCE
jgi:hypothetical protein